MEGQNAQMDVTQLDMEDEWTPEMLGFVNMGDGNGVVTLDDTVTDVFTALTSIVREGWQADDAWVTEEPTRLHIWMVRL